MEVQDLDASQKAKEPSCNPWWALETYEKHWSKHATILQVV